MTTKTPEYVVVHPMDDVPEVKHHVTGLMKLSLGAKISLMVLRLYLLFIAILCIYKLVFDPHL